MGREVKRVALDFDWPVGKTWAGYLNPHYFAKPCPHCKGGYSPEMKILSDRWYGHLPFRPEDRGSVPFTPADAPIRAFAERNVRNSPDYHGSGDPAIQREAERLCGHFNDSWSHHLNDDDVAALVAAGRLMDLTHTWTPETRWQPKAPAYIPTAREVNEWSIGGFGHDSINQWVVCKAECARHGWPTECAYCGGESEVWPSRAEKHIHDAWQQVEPPAGDGYQIWETVSEGSPISPVFATPEGLARHMAGTKWGADDGTGYETWLAFINGPGWAPSMIGTDSGIVNGVQGVVEMAAE